LPRSATTEVELASLQLRNEPSNQGDDDSLLGPLGELMAPKLSPNPKETIEDPVPEVDLSSSLEPISLLEDKQYWFRKLIGTAQGILGEDDHLQIGLRQEYNGADGQITLFLGNKNATAVLNEINLTIAPASSYHSHFLLAPAASLAPKAQNKCVLSVSALAPALETPSLIVKYRLGAQMVVHQLTMPCVNTKFMKPVYSMESTDFFRIWQSNAGPLKLQEVITRPYPMDANQCNTLLTSLNFGILQGLDANQNNVVAAASYLGGMSQSSSMVLVRIEINPMSRQQFRVTVTSSDPTLTSTTKEVIKEQVHAV